MMAATIQLSCALCLALACVGCGSDDRVTAAPPTPLATPAVSASPAVVTEGGLVTVSVTADPGGRLDWLGLFKTTSGDQGVIDWRYLNGSKSPPAAGVQSASVTFPMPLLDGRYDLRLFADDGYVKLATSNAVQVQSAATTSIGSEVPPTVIIDRNHVVYLTFDDGPAPAATPQVLDVLAAHRAPATFFLMGWRVPGNEGLVRREASEGHQVANHQMQHEVAPPPSQSPTFRSWVEDERVLLDQALGRPHTRYFRYPYGEGSAEKEAVLRELGYPDGGMGWDLDSHDWCYGDGGGTCDRPEVPAAYRSDFQGYLRWRVSTLGGGVLLLHDVHAAPHLDAFLTWLEGQGYRVAALPARPGPGTGPPPNPCTDPDTTGVKLAPPAGVYHGAYLGVTPDAPVTDAAISAFEALSIKRLALVYFESTWGDNGVLNIRFPTTSVRTIWNHGAVPFIRFKPWTTRIEYQADPVVRMKDIVDTTRFDGDMVRWLLAAKATRIPLVVQFGVEVNGNWFPWNGYWNGRGTRTWRDPTWPDGPEAYRLAYQKLITLARQNNVWNITWAFHVSHWPEPAERTSSWNQMRYYYPGDSYIDWLGLSVYGEMHPYGDPIQWNPFSDLLGATNPQLVGGLSPYQEVLALTSSSSKPIGIFETAVVEDPAAGDKGAWIRATYSDIGGSRFPRLKSVNWWNERWDNEPPMGPSIMLVDSSASSLQGYRAAVSSSRVLAVPSFRCTRQVLP